MNTLDALSIVSVYSAMTLYAAAFVLFALDLANRGRHRAPALVAGATNAAHDSAAISTLTRAPVSIDTRRNRPALARVAMSLTVLAAILHLAGTVLRGVAAGRLPWANMYEFALTGTLLIVLVFLVTLLRVDIRYLGAPLLGLILILLGVGTVRYYVTVSPLPPALQSYWLVIHVSVAMIATGYFAVGFLLTVAQLARARFEGTRRVLPPADELEHLAYRMNIVGFILWTFTLMAGAIWAERAWGRYWGWDTKEVWTFIIWVLYAGFIHARATRGWRGSRAGWLSIIAFGAVLFNFGVVNVFFKGLHAYSGL